MRVVSFGDAHFDRGVRTAVRDSSARSLLESTRALRNGAVSLVNLETPLCDPQLPPRAKKYSLRSPAGFAKDLRAAGFTHAVLANNHVLDRGRAGLVQTLIALKAAGVVPVGASLSGDPCRATMAGTSTDSVALLAAVLLPGEDGRFLCHDEARLVARLKVLRRRGIAAVVTLHWGSEFDPLASREQMATAARLVRAGAVAIVGNHAHVVQGSSGRDGVPSLVSGAPVWYGIGNFLFDQWQPWTRRALAVQMDVSDGRLVGWKSLALRRDGPFVRPE